MYAKVKKPFGLLKVGDKIELKGSDHHKALIETGHIEETEPEVIEAPKPISGAYSTSSIVDDNSKTEKPVKAGKKKEDKK